MSLYWRPDSLRDDFYEWLLSDAPAAQAERQRRRDAALRHERTQRRLVQAWSFATQVNPRAPQHLVELAGVLDRSTARQAAAAAERAMLSDAERVRRARGELENSRQAQGDFDYRYPAAYTGPGAAAQPIPDEPVQPVELRPGMRVREFIGQPAFTVAHVQGTPDHLVVVDTTGRRHDYDTPVQVGVVRDDRYAGPINPPQPTLATAVDEPGPDWLHIEHQGLCRSCLTDPSHCTPSVDLDEGLEL